MASELTTPPRDEAHGEPVPRYRRDIDGLRAIAVTSVVLFHAGLFPFRSGFVGVDIFFVISGYLIGGIILRSAMLGSFRFSNFYARRARRILPALLMVLIACCLAGWFLFSASEYQGLSATAISALLATSNFSFWRFQDYFQSDAHLKPLLMTWSLGVEEQFYFLFPFLILGTMRWMPRQIVPILTIVTLVSFLFSLWATNALPVLAFYLLPARAWELGVGAALVAWEINRTLRGAPSRSGRFDEWLGAAGILMLACAIFCFDSTVPFPGWLALLPVVGTATLIAAESSAVNRYFLSARAMVFTGAVSYSWYLWHWPMMSFVHIVSASKPSVFLMTLVAAASLIIAVLSWWLIERPFRQSKLPPGRLLVRYAAALGIAIAVAGVIKYGHGIPQRLPTETVAFEKLIVAGRGNCLAMFEESKPDTSSACVMKRAGRSGIVLIGDSHAAALGPGLRDLAVRRSISLAIYTKSSCGPLLGVRMTHDQMPFFPAACSAFMENALNRAAADPDFQTIILAGLWASYYQMSPATLRDGIANTLAMLKNKGKRIIVMGDVPSWQFDPARLKLAETLPMRLFIARRFWAGGINRLPLSGLSELSVPVPQDITDILIKASTAADAGWIDMIPVLCSLNNCMFEHDGDLLYLDHAHLSTLGSRFLIGHIEQQLLPAR